MRHPQIAIVAYGSLIHTPGDELADLIVRREPCITGFPVEYGRRSPKWGGGPTLTVDRRGAPVEGQRLVLRPGLPLGSVIDTLARREGIPSADGIIQLESRSMTELTCALPRNLSDDDIAPERLARHAVQSVSRGSLNGVAYLRAARGVGIETPRTHRYAEEVMRIAGCDTLDDAERVLA